LKKKKKNSLFVLGFKKKMSRSTLRILALHGWKQNAKQLKAKCGALRKECASVAEFVFIDAPHLADDNNNASTAAAADDDLGAAPAGESRTWWQFAESNGMEYFGVDAMIATVRAALQQHAPIDGLLGFSQGAAVATLLLNMMHNSSLRDDPAFASIKFGLLVSGFKPRAVSLQPHLIDRSVTTPVLMLVGKDDRIIKPATTLASAALFTDCTIFEHATGHVVATRETIPPTLEFLRRFLPLLEQPLNSTTPTTTTTDST
jgi:predicted esterase